MKRQAPEAVPTTRLLMFSSVCEAACTNSALDVSLHYSCPMPHFCICIYSTCCNEVVFGPVYIWCCFVCVTDDSHIAVKMFDFGPFCLSLWSPFVVRCTLIRTSLMTLHGNKCALCIITIQRTWLRNGLYKNEKHINISYTDCSQLSLCWPTYLRRHPLFVCLKIS